MTGKKWALRIILLALFFAAFAGGFHVTLASSTDGTVSGYAWGENLGWINFGCANCDVHVTDNAVAGYAWSRDYGWINLSPSQGGVTNDGNGNLGGFAWSEQFGWIPFTGVIINSSGQFTGTAGADGTAAGRISFNCPTTGDCNVTTDWRPVSVRNANNSGPGSGGGVSGGGGLLGSSASSDSANNQGNGNNAAGGNNTTGSASTSPSVNPSLTESPTYVETHDEPLSLNPTQSGQYTQDTHSGPVILTVPAANVTSRTTFFINIEPISTANSYLIPPGIQLVNSVFYNVYAKDQNGNFVHSFSHLITIILPIPLRLQHAANLGVYWLDSASNQWVSVPNVVFANSRATLRVDHLTQFAIFGTLAASSSPGTGTGAVRLAPTLPLPPKSTGANNQPRQREAPWYWSVIFGAVFLLAIIWLIYRRRNVQRK